jgi:long-chain acyl-CoA synthetase
MQITSLLSLGLLEMGIKKGDNVGIVSENRPEWNFIDLACQQIGAVTVPMYPNIGPRDYRYIFQQAEIKAVFISNSQILTKIRKATENMKSLPIFTFNNIKGFDSWRKVLDLGKSKDIKELKKHRDAVQPDDLMTIIFTSGTTGAPKGVMLTHENVLSNALAIKKASTVDPGDRALSFLPLNHIYERTISYLYMYLSVGIYYAESIDTIADNLKEIKPHAFNTVPRLLEKVYDKIIKKGSELGGLKKGVFNWAISLGLNYDPNEEQGGLAKRQLKVARKLVFSKWQEALGGNIKQINCGAAALQPRLARVFWAAGIKVFEGYGLTETAPVVAANMPGAMRIGTVGPILENVEVRIADDGEIEVKGPNVMKGYYKDPEMTKEVMTSDGWFKTGDVGNVIDGYLKITDRKKELFKTSGGLYIAPQQIENKLKESTLIEHAMVIGDGRKFPAALIVPNLDELTEAASNRFILISDFQELVKDPQIMKLFQKDIEKISEDYGKWEKIKDFRIIPDSWSVESGELTPTMKLKRRVILEKYAHIVNDIYKDDGSRIFDDVDEVDMNSLDKEILEEIKE